MKTCSWLWGDKPFPSAEVPDIISPSLVIFSFAGLEISPSDFAFSSKAWPDAHITLTSKAPLQASRSSGLPSMAIVAQIFDLRWLFGSVLLTLYVIHKIRSYRRLSAFGGPFGVGFTNFWHTKALLTWRSHLWYKEVCDKHGEFRCHHDRPPPFCSLLHRTYRSRRPNGLDYFISRAPGSYECGSLTIHKRQVVQPGDPVSAWKRSCVQPTGRGEAQAATCAVGEWCKSIVVPA